MISFSKPINSKDKKTKTPTNKTILKGGDGCFGGPME